GSRARDATQANPLTIERTAICRAAAPLGFPGLERAYFPLALLLLAGFSLEPGLRVTAHKTRQKIAASSPFQGVGGCDRGDSATGAGARIFPRHAGVLLALAEQCAGRSACISEISIRWQLSRFLCAGRRCD